MTPPNKVTVRGLNNSAMITHIGAKIQTQKQNANEGLRVNE